MPQNTPNRAYTYPTYTDAMDFPAQIQELATDIDTDVTTLVSQVTGAKNRPSVRVSASVAQNITTATNTLLTFATENYDNDAMANLGVTPTAITLNDSGIYLLTGRATFNAFGSGGTFYISAALLSSAGFIPTSSTTSLRGHATEPTWISISSLHYTTGAVPDNITLQVRQESGNTLACTFRNLCATKISNLSTGI
jgi:hypothetical protein